MKRSPLKLLVIPLFLILLVSPEVRAMEIRKFDKMDDRDQAEFIGDLIIGAENVLTGAGRAADSAKVKHLFTTKDPGDADVVGMVEFERNLALLRVDDARNAVKNPKDPRIEVEDAMAVTLEKNGIKLPDSFFTVNKGFKPKYPPAK
jgi:hypothetical protein